MKFLHEQTWRIITSAELITTVISCFALVEIVTIPTIAKITVITITVMSWVIQIEYLMEYVLIYEKSILKTLVVA